MMKPNGNKQDFGAAFKGGKEKDTTKGKKPYAGSPAPSGAYKK